MILSTHGDATRRIAAHLLGAAVLLGAFAARAEPSPRDPAAAEALFRVGRDLLAQDNYAEGCPKFEASFALDPSTGTLLNIAKCNEHDGKIATAWANYTRALVLNQETQGEERRRALEDLAKQGIDALAPRLPRLRIIVEHPPAGLEVLRDGKAQPTATLGEALPVDPGPHEIRLSAPGYQTETRPVTLEEGKTTALSVALVKGAGAGQPTPAQGGVPAWAWVSGGIGIALAGVSIVFLTQDLAAISALRSNCYVSPDGTSSCKPGYDPRGENARKDRSLGLFLGLGGAGVLAIGAGAVGIVRARSAPAKTLASRLAASPWVVPGAAGLSVHGGF